MCTCFKTKNIEQLRGKGIFFDTNILIYLFWTSSNEEDIKRQKSYSTIFNKLLLQKNTLYINIVVLSEIINAILRIELSKHNEYRSSEFQKCKKYKEFKQLPFKQFRNSKEGKQASKDLHATIITKIFKYFNITDKLFDDKALIQEFLNVDSLDFNDKLIVSICKEKQLVLLTNDIDYKDTDLEILTANHKYFK